MKIQPTLLRRALVAGALSFLPLIAHGQAVPETARKAPAGHPAAEAAPQRSQQQLAAAFSWSPARPAAGQEVIFLAKDLGPGVTYQWQVAGQRRSGASARHSFAEPGEVTVRLEVRRGAVRDTIVQRVQVLPAKSGSPADTACPEGFDCHYRWLPEEGRHEVHRTRAGAHPAAGGTARSTGSLDLDLELPPAIAAASHRG